MSKTTIIFIFLTLLLSCNNNSKEIKNTKPVIPNSNIESNSQQNTKTEQKTTDESDYKRPVLNIPGKPIDNKILIKMLPDEISGTQHTPPSSGVVFTDDNNKTTTVSASYKYNKGGVQISITDYGSFDKIPDIDQKFFIIPPKEIGFDNEVIRTDEGKGFISWDNESNSGKMYYLFLSRMIIKIDAYKIPAGSGGLISYLNLIKLNELKTQAEKSNK